MADVRTVMKSKMKANVEKFSIDDISAYRGILPRADAQLYQESKIYSNIHKSMVFFRKKKKKKSENH